MALFLSESYNSRVQYSDINTILAEMSEIIIDGGSLTEAIYRADFLLHEESKSQDEKDEEAANRTESQYTEKSYKDRSTSVSDKKLNFLQKSWEAIKAFAKKVWLKIKQVGAWVVDKIKVAWAKITNSSSNVVKIRKNKFLKAKLNYEHAENLKILIQRKWESASDLKDAANDLKEKYKDKIDNISDDTDIITVSKSEFKKYFDNITKVIKETADTLVPIVNAPKPSSGGGGSGGGGTARIGYSGGGSGSRYSPSGGGGGGSSGASSEANHNSSTKSSNEVGFTNQHAALEADIARSKIMLTNAATSYLTMSLQDLMNLEAALDHGIKSSQFSANAGNSTELNRGINDVRDSAIDLRHKVKSRIESENNRTIN